MTNFRKISNLLLSPRLQIQLGIFGVLLSIIFSLFVILLINMNFGALFDTILDLTEVRDEVSELVAQHFRDTITWLSIACIAFIFANVGLAVWYTHRFLGPAIAFKRHIDALIDGDYTVQSNLRKGDAFQDLMDRLNLLSLTLAERQKQSSNNGKQLHGNG